MEPIDFGLIFSELVANGYAVLRPCSFIKKNLILFLCKLRSIVFLTSVVCDYCAFTNGFFKQK